MQICMLGQICFRRKTEKCDVIIITNLLMLTGDTVNFPALRVWAGCVPLSHSLDLCVINEIF